MNAKRNISFLKTEEKLEKAVMLLLEEFDYNAISVSDICFLAKINRSTFYAHYQDVNDYIIKLEEKIGQRVKMILGLTRNNPKFSLDTFVEFFKFIKEYKVFYKAFLESRYPSFVAKEMLPSHVSILRDIFLKSGTFPSKKVVEYHLVFFGAGLKGLCGRWIQNDCQEDPKMLAEITLLEYSAIISGQTISGT